MTDSLFDAIGREAGEWLSPIVRVAQDPTSLDMLLASVGVIVPDAQRAALLAPPTAIAALRPPLAVLLSKPARYFGRRQRDGRETLSARPTGLARARRDVSLWLRSDGSRAARRHCPLSRSRADRLYR